jgi:hypothetical protein
MTIEELKQEINQLPPAEQAQLAAWLEERQAEEWDRQIERDAQAGKLDNLIREAKEEFRAGRTTPL